jgi:DNA polymerase-3 subunit delta
VKATQKDFATAAQRAIGAARVYFFCGADEAGAHDAAQKSWPCCPIPASGSSSPAGIYAAIP